MGHRTLSNAIVWSLAVLASACSTSSGSRTEPVGRSQQPIINSTVDNDTSENNVVVHLISCTGSLITPRIVLTANHCIFGAEVDDSCQPQRLLDVYIGPNTGGGGGRPFRSVAQASFYNRCLPENGSASDLALLYLEEPVTQSALNSRVDLIPAEQRPAVPRVVRPSLIPWSGDNIFGAAGYGGTPRRQFVEFRNIDAVEEGDNAWQWEGDGAGFVSRFVGGDSGGPIFVRRPDQSLDIVGAHYGKGSGSSVVIWPDITRGVNRNWLLAHVQEQNVPVELRHGPGWLARHHRTPESWWGEPDYSGPCQEGDRDCDGWFDENDNCPFVPNPDQAELNDITGTAGACSRCPFDPLNDIDGDGVCGVARPGDPNPVVDNCPMTFNPSQANCNREAERSWNARHPEAPVPELGDACDPVPCPEGENAFTRRVETRGNCTEDPYEPNLCEGRELRERIAITPRPPAIRGQVGLPLFPPLRSVPTHARFCQQGNPEQGFDCSDLLKQGDENLNFWPNAEAETLDPAHLWHRITHGTCFHVGLIPVCIGPGARTTRGGSLPLEYRLGTTSSFGWGYREDHAFWSERGIIPTSPDPSCMDAVRFGPGTCLDGRMWLHAETLAGSDITHSFVDGVFIGFHGLELANHYFEVAPDRPFTEVSGGMRFHFPFFLWRTLPDPPPFSVWRFHEGVAAPIIREGSEFYAVFEDGLRRRATDLVEESTRAVLFDPTVRWIAAAEASPFAGDSSRPLALDFSSDGSAIGGGLVVRDGKLTRSNVCIGCGGGSDGPNVFGHSAKHQVEFATSSAEAPGRREAFAAVYSRVDGRAFVVGGRTSDGNLVSEIWTFWLDKEMWTHVPLRPGSLGDVISATYSFRDGGLWILDVAPGDRLREVLRLLRVDPMTGQDEVVLTSRGNRAHERYDYRGLTLDMEGNVVLFASSQKSQRHRIGVIEVGELEKGKSKKAKDAWLTKHRERALATPPFIDLRGIGLYFEPPPTHRGSPPRGKRPEDENRPSNRTAAGERLRELPVHHAHLHQLEDLLQ